MFCLSIVRVLPQYRTCTAAVSHVLPQYRTCTAAVSHVYCRSIARVLPQYRTCTAAESHVYSFSIVRALPQYRTCHRQAANYLIGPYIPPALIPPHFANVAVIRAGGRNGRRNKRPAEKGSGYMVTQNSIPSYTFQ